MYRSRSHRLPFTTRPPLFQPGAKMPSLLAVDTQLSKTLGIAFFRSFAMLILIIAHCQVVPGLSGMSPS